MQLYYNLNGGAIGLSLFDRTTLQTPLSFKRGSIIAVQLQFHRDGTPELLPDSSALLFGIKLHGKFDDDYLCSVSSFTVPGDSSGFYTGSMATNTTKINTALLTPDGDATNDIPSIQCDGEIQFLAPGADLPDKSQTIPVQINAAVNTGSEPAVVEGDPPFLNETESDARYTPIAAGNTLYVDAVNGNDSTGARGTRRPFSGGVAAQAAAVAGDTVIVRPGNYTNVDEWKWLGKDGVDWFFLPGAKLSWTQDAAHKNISIFSDAGPTRSDSAGVIYTNRAAMTYKVGGYLEFDLTLDTIADADAPSGVVTCGNPGSHITFECQDIYLHGTSTVTFFAGAWGLLGDLNVIVRDRIRGVGSATVWWTAGEMRVVAREILHTGREDAGVYYLDGDGSYNGGVKTGNFYARAEVHKSTTGHGLYALGSTTIPDWRWWIDGDLIEGASGHCSLKVDSGGKGYVEAKKLQGPVGLTNSTGEFYGTTQKLTGRGGLWLACGGSVFFRATKLEMMDNWTNTTPPIVLAGTFELDLGYITAGPGIFTPNAFAGIVQPGGAGRIAANIDIAGVLPIYGDVSFATLGSSALYDFGKTKLGLPDTDPGVIGDLYTLAGVLMISGEPANKLTNGIGFTFPTSDPGVTGAIWNNGGVLTIS